MNLDQYLAMFIDESKDHLQELNENLLELERDSRNLTIVQHIFRSAHTLKGMSATMGFEDVTRLTHEMENVLDLVRNGRLQIDAGIFDLLFRCLDELEKMVQDIVQGGRGQADVSGMIAELGAVIAAGTGAASQQPVRSALSAAAPMIDVDEFQLSILRQSIELGRHAFHIQVILQEDSLLKAARAYMVFDRLERGGDIVGSAPSVERLEQDDFGCSFEIYYVTEVEGEQVESWVASISEVERVVIRQLDLAKLERLDQGRDDPRTAAIETMSTVSSEHGAAPGSVAGESASVSPLSAAIRTIRVDIDRLDKLMNLFSELLIDRVRLEQLASDIRRNDLTETVEHMARIGGDLQNIVLKMRMVPVDTVFNRFPRMIRDIAKSHRKSINLVISGADTELDRTVIEEIGDPLVHLLRNAADHGLESSSKRLTAGKDEMGLIHLRAYHSGNHVFIEVEDDGHGISRDKVLAKAIKNGLLSREAADKLHDHEVYALLFASGFSTAEQISDLSGRGVGLDVVKSKIHSLGGNVGVDSTPGKGTRFTIQLPLTLSIITALLIRAGDEEYAIPLSSIVETVSVSQDAVNLVHGNRLFDYRGSVIPVISLCELFEVPRASGDRASQTEMAIIQKGDKLAALEVDAFIGQQDIVLKSPGKYLTPLFAISGATIRGDGRVAFIIDTNALIR